MTDPARLVLPAGNAAVPVSMSHAALVLGVRAAYHPNPVEAGIIGAVAGAYGATVMIGTPTFLRRIASACPPEQPAGLRLAITGAEPCPRMVVLYRQPHRVACFALLAGRQTARPRCDASFCQALLGGNPIFAILSAGLCDYK